MKKNARVKYNEDLDQFEIWFKSNGEWLLEVSYKCKAMPGKEVAEYVHWSILAKIRNLQDLGYEVKVL